MTVFSSEYYVGDDEIKNTKGYNIAAVLCAVMIIALLITTVVLGSKNAYELETVPSFELAIDEGRYSDALDIYRGVQDDVLKTPVATGVFFYYYDF